MCLYNQLKRSFRNADVGFGLSGCSLSVPHVPSEASPALVPPPAGVRLIPVGTSPPQAGPAALSLGCIKRFARAETSYPSFIRIPILSAHTRIWENNPPGRGGGRWGRPSPAPRSARPSASLHRCMAARPDRAGKAAGSGLPPGEPRRYGLRTSGPGPCRSPRTPCPPGWRRKRRACRRRSP